MNFSPQQIKLAGDLGEEEAQRDFEVGLDLQGSGIQSLRQAASPLGEVSDCEAKLSESESERGALAAVIGGLNTENEDLAKENEDLAEENDSLLDFLNSPYSASRSRSVVAPAGGVVSVNIGVSGVVDPAKDKLYLYYNMTARYVGGIFNASGAIASITGWLQNITPLSPNPFRGLNWPTQKTVSGVVVTNYSSASGGFIQGTLDITQHKDETFRWLL